VFKLVFIIPLFFASTAFCQPDYLEIYKNSTNIFSSIFSNNFENEIVAPFNLNVYGYYKLEDIYNTPLKRKRFEKSSEYKQLLDSLKFIKKQVKSKWFNVETTVYLKHYYDVETGIYIINGILGYNSVINERGIYSINDVLFPQLSGRLNFENEGLLPNLSIHFPCNEDFAATLEDIIGLKLVFLFKVEKINKIHFNSLYGPVDLELPVANNPVLLIFDENNKYYASLNFKND